VFCSMNAICCGGDVCGYIWGRLTNVLRFHERCSANLFRCVDYRTQKFCSKPSTQGIQKTLSPFLQYLLAQRPNQRIALIWDAYELPPLEGTHCLFRITQPRLRAMESHLYSDLFPMIQTKTSRRYLVTGETICSRVKQRCKSFCSVRVLFELVTHRQTFTFPKLFFYVWFRSFVTQIGIAVSISC